MPKPNIYCIAAGCSNNNKDLDISFFTLPSGQSEKEKERCAARAASLFGIEENSNIYGRSRSSRAFSGSALSGADAAMVYELKGKVALVTGAANGVGAGVVKMLLAEGAKHVAILDVDERTGEKFQNELNAEFGANKSRFYKCDVTNDDQLFGAFRSVVEGHGGIDLVVNNAGIMNDAAHVYKKQIEINVTALVTSTLKALELMRTDEGGKGGTVLNIASIAGLSQASLLPIYFATKAAVIQFSNCIGKEDYYEKTGVRVVAVCFGATDTALLSRQKMGSLDKNMDGDNLASYVNEYPKQRMESAAQGVIDAYKKGVSGSTWVASRDLPAVDITDNVNRAYEILGEYN